MGCRQKSYLRVDVFQSHTVAEGNHRHDDEIVADFRVGDSNGRTRFRQRQEQPGTNGGFRLRLHRYRRHRLDWLFAEIEKPGQSVPAQAGIDAGKRRHPQHRRLGHPHLLNALDDIPSRLAQLIDIDGGGPVEGHPKKPGAAENGGADGFVPIEPESHHIDIIAGSVRRHRGRRRRQGRRRAGAEDTLGRQRRGGLGARERQRRTDRRQLGWLAGTGRGRLCSCFRGGGFLFRCYGSTWHPALSGPRGPGRGPGGYWFRCRFGNGLAGGWFQDLGCRRGRRFGGFGTGLRSCGWGFPCVFRRWRGFGRTFGFRRFRCFALGGGRRQRDRLLGTARPADVQHHFLSGQEMPDLGRCRHGKGYRDAIGAGPRPDAADIGEPARPYPSKVDPGGTLEGDRGDTANLFERIRNLARPIEDDAGVIGVPA